jgi:leucine dehydrogenase
MLREQVEVEGYEKVYRYIDEDFHAFIAIHSTQLGPALGGCRIRSYQNDDAALTDVLRLSKGMTLKNSAAGLWYGGGKCVVNAPAASRDIMLKVGEIVEELNGTYITGEDVGTTVPDIKIAAEKTSHVLSLGEAGDPSPWTALGVFECIKAVRKLRYVNSTQLHVWVQGLGKVGWDLAHRLYGHGYKLYVSDIVMDREDAAHRDLGAIVYNSSMADEIDIYAPCALGGVIDASNVNDISFPIICGSANNQLADDSLADILDRRGVLYCPDFIVNAGGVIAAAAELTGYDFKEVLDDVTGRGEVLMNVIKIGEMMGLTPLRGAETFAYLRL